MQSFPCYVLHALVIKLLSNIFCTVYLLYLHFRMCTVPVLARMSPSVGTTSLSVFGNRLDLHLKWWPYFLRQPCVAHGSLSKCYKWSCITFLLLNTCRCKELVEKWVLRLPDWHLCQPSGVPPAEHSRCKSQTDTNLPEWSYQVLSLHMKSCFPVWSHWNLPFSLKLFLLPSLFRVEGLMERKRLCCSVVRDHLNYKFNLCFSPQSHLTTALPAFRFCSFLPLLHSCPLSALDCYRSLNIYRGRVGCLEL